MGRRGPPPQPTKLRIVKGNPGKRALPKNEPKPPRECPTCPEWLGEEARAAWSEVAPTLDAVGLLTKLDRDALTAYCQTYARWKAAEEFIQQHGETYPLKNEQGTVTSVQQFPQVSIARNQLILLRAYQREFGMTPASRVGLEVDPARNTPEETEFFGS